MHPIHDVDALLLLALALSSKRRPAELVEVMAATDLIQTSIPPEAKLVDAFSRLASHGLVVEAAGGFLLTDEAQKIMGTLSRKKLETDERIFNVKEKLASYHAKGEHPAIVLSVEQIGAAILAHRTAAKAPGKNLLVPKPKPEGDVQRPGQRQRKPLPAARRRKP
jgi:hypothetical protein